MPGTVRIMGQLSKWNEKASASAWNVIVIITVDRCSEELGGLAESHFCDNLFSICALFNFLNLGQCHVTSF